MKISNLFKSKEERAAEEEAARQREYSVRYIMAETGWTREETLDRVRDAKKRCEGLTYRKYYIFDLYKIPESEQAEQYPLLLKQYNEHEEDQKRLQKEKFDRDKEAAVIHVMEATGWTRSETLARMKAAHERTGCRKKEYSSYRFYELSEEEQSRIALRTISKQIEAEYDVDRCLSMALKNKEKANRLFADYLGREWCINNQITEEDFVSKFRNTGRLIYKPYNGNKGIGVEAYDIVESSLSDIYALLQTKPRGVVEEGVKQHRKMMELYSNSVNTIRVVSISSQTRSVMKTGEKSDIAYCALRIGSGNAVVDNFHSGGMVAGINIETGTVDTPAVNMAGDVYEVHPDTGTAIRGFEIPMFDEAVRFVLRIIDEMKIEGFLGWDIAVTEPGPVIIEVNNWPSTELLSMPYAADGIGKKAVLEKYLFR